MPAQGPLGVGVAVAGAVVLACALAPRLERALFESVAARLWRSSLSGESRGPARSRGARAMAESLFDRALHVVSSGPFKAPFGASVVLLAFSGRLTPLPATAALLSLWVLRCASTAQTHGESPLVERWRAEHGVVSVPRDVWPRSTLLRLARITHRGLGTFEHEDLRAYLVLVFLLRAADPSLPQGHSGALAATALLLAAVILFDATRAFALQFAYGPRGVHARPAPSQGSTASLPPPTAGRLARVGLCSFALGSAVALPVAASIPLLPMVLPSAALIALVAAQALGLAGVLAGRGARDEGTDASRARLILSPSAGRRVHFERDVGAGTGSRGTSLLFLWVRTRARLEGIGFAAAVRASSRADLLITGLVVATLLL